MLRNTGRVFVFVLRRSLSLSALLALLASAPSGAASPAPPSISAKAWVLLDAVSGRELASQAADARIEPDRLSQTMTAFVVCGALARGAVSPQQSVTPSEKLLRAAASGPAMYLDAGKPIPLTTVMNGMAVLGARDASLALAEAVAGDEAKFVAMMNAEAQRLGLTATRFANVSGVSAAGQYSSARDLAHLAARFIAQCPQQYAAYSGRSITHNQITQQSGNRLLWLDPSVDGLATADSRAGGWSMIASASRGPRRLVAVVAGATSEAARAQAAQQLLNFGFQAYDTVRLFGADQAVRELKVWKGASRQVKVGFQDGLVVAVPRDRVDALQIRLESRQPLLAPLSAGQAVGKLTLTLDGESYGEYPVVALEEVPLASWLRRTWDALRLWLS